MTVTASTSTATDELLSHDRWSREQLLEYQGDRLREVIEHAVSASPYYREALGGDALAEDVRLERSRSSRSTRSSWSRGAPS